MKYKARVTRITVAPADEPIFSELATHIEIDGDIAGEYVKVNQQGGHTDLDKWVCFEPDSWPTIRDEIEKMLESCRKSK